MKTDNEMREVVDIWYKWRCCQQVIHKVFCLQIPMSFPDNNLHLFTYDIALWIADALLY